MSVSLFSSLEECQGDDVISPKANEKDIYVQLVISMALGVSSFIAFCVGFGMLPSILRLHILTIMRSYYVRDGRASMRPENDIAMQPWLCRIYRIHFSAGYQCYSR
jgi:hypothetical protein